MPRTTASSSSSIAAGVPRSTRNNSSMRRSRSTDPKRKPPDGWPPPTRLLTCQGTRSTSGPPMPPRGCPRTAPSTGYARSTATNPGTTNCARRPSITAALPSTPTLRTIQGCSSDARASTKNRCQPFPHTNEQPTKRTLRRESMSRKLWPLAALATVALIGAGCSNDSAENGSTGTGTASSTGTTSSGANKKLTARDKAVKFAECVRAHGVSDFPDPDERNQFQYGVSVTPVVWKKAVNACKDLQPPGTLS